jgi:hypothetical protein
LRYRFFDTLEANEKKTHESSNSRASVQSSAFDVIHQRENKKGRPEKEDILFEARGEGKFTCCQSNCQEELAVILPMVLQIGETMVLQRVELEEKASSSHFWVFG